MQGSDRIIRNEKVRGSNPLSSTETIPPLTCDGAVSEADEAIDQAGESRPTGRPSDPIAALIAAHAPTTTAEILRPLPVPSEAAQADSERRRRQAQHNETGTPRGLISVSGIRCGEHL